MINYIKNIIKLPGLYHSFIKNSKYQRRFLKITIANAITESRKTNDNSLDDQDYRKINLYGYAVPAMLGEAYCSLRGRGMLLKERLAITYLGAITGLFDDFFDKKNIAESHIKKLIENANDLIGNNANERLFLDFYRNALQNSADVNQVKSYFLKVHDAQILSKRQQSPDIELDEIKNITFQKGGVSMLLYRSTFSESIGRKEEMMLYKLGSLGQLENDIFDVYKDYKEGIKTLATTETSISNLRNTYKSLMEETFSLVRQTNYPDLNKRRFLRIISLVMCRGYVCLDMLEKNEKSTRNVFSIPDYEKRNLICDMENPVSLLKLIDYSAKCKIE